MHLPGAGASESVLRQGHRHLAHRLPAVRLCLAGGVRRGSSDAQQPEAHRGREGQDGVQGEGSGKEPSCQEQHGQRDRRDAASCQHPACQWTRFDNFSVCVCVCVCVLVCTCVCVVYLYHQDTRHQTTSSF